MSRDWSKISSADAFKYLCENRALNIIEKEDIFFAAAFLLGDMAEVVETNWIHTSEPEESEEERFIWARTQTVAEGLTFARWQVGPPLILLDGRQFDRYIEQAIFLFQYYADWFWEIAGDNRSGGDVVVRELREYAELSLRMVVLLKEELKGFSSESTDE